MQCLEHSHIISTLRHISGKRQSGRTGTYHGNLDTVLLRDLRNRDITALTFVISGETLQVANGTASLLIFKWIHLLSHCFPADRHDRKQRAEHLSLSGLSGLQEFPTLDILDKSRYIDIYRTSLHTSRIRTIQTALGLLHGLFFCQA